jgi:hypothetical protein
LVRRQAELQGQAKAIELERESVAQKVGMAKARIALRDDLNLVLETLRDRVHQRAVGMYETLLTTFMREVLPEQSVDRSMAVDLVTRRGQSAMAFNVQRADGAMESVYDGNGGALTNVVSAALRLIALRKAQRTLPPRVCRTFTVFCPKHPALWACRWWQSRTTIHPFWSSSMRILCASCPTLKKGWPSIMTVCIGHRGKPGFVRFACRTIVLTPIVSWRSAQM